MMEALTCCQPMGTMGAPHTQPGCQPAATGMPTDAGYDTAARLATGAAASNTVPAAGCCCCCCCCCAVPALAPASDFVRAGAERLPRERDGAVEDEARLSFGGFGGATVAALPSEEPSEGDALPLDSAEVSADRRTRRHLVFCKGK